MQRKQWLTLRKTGIGGSDAAAILGLSPWKSAMDVWMDKKGLVPERADPDKEFLFTLGQELEPVIARLYINETGRQLALGELTRHPLYPILIGTPDRLVVGDFRGVELKTENQFSDSFGDPGTDEVPHHYLIQCAHYMAILGYHTWDIAVLHAGVRFAIYTLSRDIELETIMIDRLREWWDRHIVQGVPPDVDSSDAWRVYLHRKHPYESLPIEKIDPEKAGLMERLGQVRRAEKVLEAMRSEYENQLKAVIGDREGVVSSEYGKVTWKKTKDGKVIDWQSAYRDLRVSVTEAWRQTGVMQPELLAKTLAAFEKLAETCLEIHTQVTPGVRRFLFTPRKEETSHGQERIGHSEAERSAVAALAGNGEHSSSSTSEGTN